MRCQGSGYSGRIEMRRPTVLYLRLVYPVIVWSEVLKSISVLMRCLVGLRFGISKKSWRFRGKGRVIGKCGLVVLMDVVGAVKCVLEDFGKESGKGGGDTPSLAFFCCGGRWLVWCYLCEVLNILYIVI